MIKHTILGGKVHVYKRDNSQKWQCSTYIKGKNRRATTGEESLKLAKDFAEDWYLEIVGKNRRGELTNGITFRQASKRFLDEYDVLTEGQRNKEYVEGHHMRIRVHLNPYFGNMGVTEISSGVVQEYRVYRVSGESGRKSPARSTLHHETVTLRQVLKSAYRHGDLEHVPDLTLPYGASQKITHRAWFSPEEYKQLYEATRANVAKAKGKHWHRRAQQLHDYVLFMANTGLRPDEANRLQYRDVIITDDEYSGGNILEIEVRGKRGVGFCKSTKGAVRPFERLVERNNPKNTDLIFPENQKKQFNRILAEQDLKFDRDGNRRTAYSLRHTYICLRLIEGADIYQIAKNCRTSVEMIEKYYASHIKNRIDTSLINVRRKRRIEVENEAGGNHL